MGALLDAARSVPVQGQDDVLCPADPRRQTVLAMLAEQPGTRYAVVVVDPDADPVIVVVAVRDVGTCEIAIPADRFDPFALLEILARHDATMH